MLGGSRVNAFSENGIGEPDQDANSALTELDKGLRSGKVGEQCEAIVRFPRLFEKYPFPILINASLLKLADVFRVGNNFLRLCVLKVCQQSEKHLDKISNVSEFVRRIFSVIHSNDPIARSLSLRTLGAMACIIPERQQVHHSIRISLDSHDSVEVEAAIYVATQFAAQSRTFAVGLCNKISNMIQGQSTPANMKLKLIPILQHMHHDTNTAAMVRQLCVDLLPKYPTKEFVLVILNTLTKLAAATLVDIPCQVELLMKFIELDPRKEVKTKCLAHLYELAKPGAHLWPAGAINSILDFTLKLTSIRTLSLALSVIEVLAESPSLCHDYNDQHSKLRQLCAKNCFSANPAIATQSINILTQIIYYNSTECIEVTGTEDVIAALETLILLLTFADKKYPYQLKLALKCAVRLSEVNKHHCETFVELLGSRLGFVEDKCTIMICEALGAIANFQPETLQPLLPTFLNFIQQSIDAGEDGDSKLIVMLCTLVFQTLCGFRWSLHTSTRILDAIERSNLWASYRIGRCALRYGHHAIAQHAFDRLTEQVSSEHWHFWLVCLREMSRGEMQLSDCDNVDLNLVSRLDSAIVYYNKAIAALKAASTPLHNLQFQAEYLRLRLEFLQCLIQLIHTCNILCIVPPPAVASTIAQATRDEYQRHGYVTTQMRKCAKEFKQCGELYWRLYQSAFDADPTTLENIQILQQMCNLLESCIESVCTNNPTHIIQLDAKKVHLESRQMNSGCGNVIMLGNAIAEQNIAHPNVITHKHIDLLKAIVQVLMNAELAMPRFFFQTLQCTTLKLAISPQPRVLGEFISVPFGSQLAVKVEGVIQHGGKRPAIFRQIADVCVSVTSQLQPTNKNKEIDTKTVEMSTLSQNVTPHKDFFSAQFLLAFPRGGLYAIVIEASVVDAHGDTWRTGPKSTITVKVQEEAKLHPISIPGMNGNSNIFSYLMAEDALIRPQPQTHKKL